MLDRIFSRFHLVILISVASVLVETSTKQSLKPKLVAWRAKQTQNLGTKFKVFCIAQEGDRPLQFEWSKNTDRLSSSSSSHNIDLQIQTIEDESFLTIPKIKYSDSGNYTCKVRNAYGQDSQSIRLDVKGWCCASISLFSSNIRSICGAFYAIRLVYFLFAKFITK